MPLAIQAGTSHVALALLVRQAAFLLLLAALGAGPAALLARRFDLAVRVALAPALGLCVGVCLTTALIGLAPVHSTWWVVAVAALGSVGFALRLWRRGRVQIGRFGLREVAQIAVVLALAAAPIDYTLHQHASVGPSAYLVRDVVGYTAEVDSSQHLSLPDAARLNGRELPNVNDQFWATYAAGFQNMDATLLEGSANDMLGLHGTDTISSYMLVLILVGALGAFAAVRVVLGSRSWVAALAGALYGGPFYMQLFFDGSQAAIAGTAMVLPFALVGWEAIRGERRTDLVILALIAGSLLALYPLFVPGFAGAGGLVLLWLAARAYRAERLRDALRRGAWRIALVVVLAAAFASVAFARDLRYWQAILNHTQNLPALNYQFAVQILPPWLLQTGEFLNLPNFITIGGLDSASRGAVIPLALLAVVAFGVVRRRAGLALVGFVIVAAGLAYYAYSSNHGCQYCIDRNLLPVEPAAIVLVTVGVGALLAAASRQLRLLGVVAALLVFVPAALAARTEHKHFTQYNYFLEPAARALVAALPANPGPIELEGFNENISGPIEYAAVYALLAERGLTVSAPFEGDDFQADAYLTDPRPPGPEFHPDYRYVLTRLGAVASGRRVIARAGGLALERRTAPLDVTPFQGLALPLQRLDPGGIAWIDPTVSILSFYVVGGSGHEPVFARVAIRSDVGLRLSVGVTTALRHGTITACVPAIGAPPIRRAILGIDTDTSLNTPAKVPGEPYGPPLPHEQIQLTGMRAVSGHCTP
jgi:hypothetical protein